MKQWIYGKTEKSERGIKHLVTWWSHPDNLLFPWCCGALWWRLLPTGKHTTTGKAKDRRSLESLKNKPMEKWQVFSFWAKLFSDFTPTAPKVCPVLSLGRILPKYKAIHNGYVSPLLLQAWGLKVTQRNVEPNSHIYAHRVKKHIHSCSTLCQNIFNESFKADTKM